MILKKSGRKVSIKSIFKNQTVNMCFFIVLLLFSAFFLIHLLFCYQIGFPASKTQVNNEHLTLSASDWLGFLGGYLGFAGSFLMSVVVLIQSRDINKLTLAEYKQSIRIGVASCCHVDDYGKHKIEINTHSLAQSPIDSDELIYTHFCRIENSYGFDTEAEPFLFFIEITNNSKSTIEDFSVQSIELIELSERKQQFRFIKRQDMNDPADGRTIILPGGTLKRCFMLEYFPCDVQVMGWLIFNFACSSNQLLTDRVIFSKDGRKITVLNQ